MKHMILSFKMKGVQSPKPKSDIQSPKCAYGGGVISLGLSPKFYH